jgi:hypothetical protein
MTLVLLALSLLAAAMAQPSTLRRIRVRRLESVTVNQ